MAKLSDREAMMRRLSKANPDIWDTKRISVTHDVYDEYFDEMLGSSVEELSDEAEKEHLPRPVHYLIDALYEHLNENRPNAPKSVFTPPNLYRKWQTFVDKHIEGVSNDLIRILSTYPASPATANLLNRPEMSHFIIPSKEVIALCRNLDFTNTWHVQGIQNITDDIEGFDFIPACLIKLPAEIATDEIRWVFTYLAQNIRVSDSSYFVPTLYIHWGKDTPFGKTPAEFIRQTILCPLKTHSTLAESLMTTAKSIADDPDTYRELYNAFLEGATLLPRKDDTYITKRIEMELYDITDLDNDGAAYRKDNADLIARIGDEETFLTTTFANGIEETRKEAQKAQAATKKRIHDTWNALCESMTVDDETLEHHAELLIGRTSPIRFALNVAVLYRETEHIGSDTLCIVPEGDAEHLVLPLERTIDNIIAARRAAELKFEQADKEKNDALQKCHAANNAKEELERTIKDQKAEKADLEAHHTEQLKQAQKEIDELNELLGTQDGDIARLSQDIDALLTKNSVLSEQNKRLSEHADKDVDVALLEYNLAHAMGQTSTPKTPDTSPSRVQAPELPLTLPKNASEMLLWARKLHPDTLIVLPSAEEAAANFDYATPDLFEALSHLATTLPKLAFNDDAVANLEQAFTDATGFEFAKTESAQIKGDVRLKDLRTFDYDGQKVAMFSHLKCKGSQSLADHPWRIHFHIDRAKKRIVIGHVGEHLPLKSTKRG